MHNNFSKLVDEAHNRLSDSVVGILICHKGAYKWRTRDVSTRH